MKLKNAFIHRNGKEVLTANADIMVDGLGEVKIELALSDDLIRRIEEEAIAALRIRLGQKIKEQS